MREQGFNPAIVEKWNGHAKVRQDLYGFIDVIALAPGRTLAVQCCAWSDIAPHRTKILEHHNLEDVLAAGWEVQIWAWKQDQVKIETIS